MTSHPEVDFSPEEAGKKKGLFEISYEEGRVIIRPKENFRYLFRNILKWEEMEKFLQGLAVLVALAEGFFSEGRKIIWERWEGEAEEELGFEEAVERFKKGLLLLPFEWFKGKIELSRGRERGSEEELKRLSEIAKGVEEILYYLTSQGEKELKEKMINAMGDFPEDKIVVLYFPSLSSRGEIVRKEQSFPEFLWEAIEGYIFNLSGEENWGRFSLVFSEFVRRLIESLEVGKTASWIEGVKKVEGEEVVVYSMGNSGEDEGINGINAYLLRKDGLQKVVFYRKVERGIGAKIEVVVRESNYFIGNGKPEEFWELNLRMSVMRQGQGRFISESSTQIKRGLGEKIIEKFQKRFGLATVQDLEEEGIKIFEGTQE